MNRRYRAEEHNRGVQHWIARNSNINEFRGQHLHYRGFRRSKERERAENREAQKVPNKMNPKKHIIN